MRFHRVVSFFLLTICLQPPATHAKDRVTILYDAFSDSRLVAKDWGFSALIEHDGRRILFDTGNNADIFEHNVKALGIDLTKLDFVVISHRHTDHSTGIKYVLKVNPSVTIYVPSDGSNGFGGTPLPSAYLRAEASLPTKMRYFDGAPPADVRMGKLYDVGDFRLIEKTTEVAPGVFLVFTVSKVPRTLELPELTLALKGPNGLTLVDGCSHSGVEEILTAATSLDSRFYILFGGLHLVTTPDGEIDTIVDHLKNKWKLQKIAPGHCSGEPAFLRLQRAFGEGYVYAGVGTRIEIP